MNNKFYRYVFIAEEQESLKTMYHEQEPANKRSRLESDQVEESKRLVNNVWARSQSEIVETNFQWVIENFSFQSHEIEERILNPEFSLASNGKLKFRLELLRKGNRDVNGFITVNLMRINSSECTSPPVSIKAEISLLNGQQEIMQSHCSPLASHCKYIYSSSLLLLYLCQIVQVTSIIAYTNIDSTDGYDSFPSQFNYKC